MVCEHLSELEQEISKAGIEETYRGQPWSKNCREWVYFRCVLNKTMLLERFRLPSFVRDHEHRGTHDGQESGFVCSLCNDAIMGLVSKDGVNQVEYPDP